MTSNQGQILAAIELSRIEKGTFVSVETRDVGPRGQTELHFSEHRFVRLDPDGRAVVMQGSHEMRLKDPKFQKIVHVHNSKH